jgi:hypothetical protein
MDGSVYAKLNSAAHFRKAGAISLTRPITRFASYRSPQVVVEVGMRF